MIQKKKLWSNDFYKCVNPSIAVCGFHKAERNWDSGPINQTINDLDIWYISKGAGSVKIDNCWFDFSTGDLIAIHPSQKYEWEKAEPENPFEMYYAHILPFGTTETPYHQELAKCWPTIIPLPTHPEIEILFNSLFEAYTTQNIGSELLLKGIASQLIYHIFDVLRRRQHSDTHLPPGYSKTLKAQQFINDNYHKEITIEEIADHCDLSVSYLSTLFKRFIGTSPIDYLIYLRLRSAKMLLAKDLSVTEVAIKTGFNSIYHFSRIFKKKFSISPSQFATTHRKKHLLH